VDSTNISGFADPHEPFPAAIQHLSAGDPVIPVWVNGERGIAFRLGSGPTARFAKWAPSGSNLDLAAETERLRWASRFAKVPQVLDSGTDPSGSWIVTAALPGESAITDRWKADPETAVRVVGAALRELHESLPVASCPFDWSIEFRLEQARVAQAHQQKWLVSAPPIDRLVVCHGDACAPNTLIDKDGTYAGHVDLGELGIADRWADLAVGSWSTEWNYGPGWEETYLEAYGVHPDPERIRYYRQLWDMESPVQAPGTSAIGEARSSRSTRRT
jgi:kanamycin kinase